MVPQGPPPSMGGWRGKVSQLKISMQTTLPLNPGNPLRNITGLARQIALPGEHVPLRFPSFPALERTAVMGFNQPATLTLKANASTAVSLFRQACWPVWADRFSDWLNVVDYHCESSANGVNVGAGVLNNLGLKSALVQWSIGNRTSTSNLPGITGAPSGHPFNYPVTGHDVGLPGPEFIYIPAGALVGIAVYLVGAAPSAQARARVTVEEWINPGQSVESFSVDVTLQANVQGNMNTAGIPGSTNGRWIRPKFLSMQYEGSTGILAQYGVSICVVNAASLTYTTSNLNAGTFAVGTLTPINAHYPLVQPAEFSNSSLPWFATKVTSSALLGTNVSQVLNKGGTILGGRMSPNVTNAWALTQAQLSNLHPAEKAFLPLETGVYTYAPPSTDLVFFSDYTLETALGAPSSPNFILSNDSMYNKMFITATAVDEQLACTVSWHLEFRTSSALFQVGLSGMTLESLHAAQLVLAETGFFFENPKHDGILGKVISTAKKFAPEVVSYVHPGAGKAMKAAIKVAKTIRPKVGPGKPVTTSAAGSGMMPKGAGKNQKKKKGK